MLFLLVWEVTFLHGNLPPLVQMPRTVVFLDTIVKG